MLGLPPMLERETRGPPGMLEGSPRLLESGASDLASSADDGNTMGSAVGA